jgi:hypothetical protein
MDIAIIPNLMTCCMMLHNLLNFQEELKIENILIFLEEEHMIKKENNYKNNHGCVQNRNKCNVATLTFDSRPRQGFARGRAKRATWECARV